MAKVAQQLNFDVHTDFGQIEGEIQDRIDLNRAKVRVAVDLSGEGVETIRQEEAVRDQLAEDVLRDFERQMGLSPNTDAPAIESAGQVPASRGKVTEGS